MTTIWFKYVPKYEFIDKYAQIGKPYKAPEAETSIEVKPLSRSLIELAKFDKQSRNIRAEIKNGLRLDLSYVLGDSIKIKKKDAIKFANWILRSYNVRKV